MFNFLLGNCSCYSSSAPDISADIELFNLDIVEALSNEHIKINLDLKFSLNCTTVFKGDVIYLSKYIPDIRRDTKLRGQDLIQENMLYLEEDAESSYSGLVQSDFDLIPDMYCVFYIRPQMKYDPMNSNWKILGMSKAFKLDLMEDENCSVLKQSTLSIDNTKSNTSFIDFFAKSILGNDSPPKHDLQISKLQQIHIDEEKEIDMQKKRSTLNKILPTEEGDKIFDFEQSFRTTTLNQTARSIPTSNKLIFDKPLEKKEPVKNGGNNKSSVKEEKLNEINDAQKFYAESLMKIKKSNQDCLISPKNKFPSIGKMKKKVGSNSKENMYRGDK